MGKMKLPIALPIATHCYRTIGRGRPIYLNMGYPTHWQHRFRKGVNR